MVVATRRAAILTPAVFSPFDISDLHFLFQADTGLYQDDAKTTPVASDGDLVGAWEDQSGNGHDLTQGTSDRRPTWKDSLGGFNAVDWVSSNDLLINTSHSLTQPWTMVAVGRFPAGTGSTEHFWMFTGLDTNRLSVNGGLNKYEQFAGKSISFPVGSAARRVIVAQFNGASSFARLNGIEQVSGDAGTTNPTTTFRLGNNFDANEAFSGYYYEFVAYNRAITIDEIEQLENHYISEFSLP